MAATRTERAIYRGLAIAAVLLVILVVLAPVFSGPQYPRYRVSCLAGMKRLGTGIVLYAADADETLPVLAGGPSPTAVGWARRIFPYVKDGRAFVDAYEVRDLPDSERTLPRVSYALNANAVALPKASMEGALAGRSVLLYEVSGAPTGRGGGLAETLALSPAGDGARAGLIDSTDPDREPTARPETGVLAGSGLDPRSEPRHGDRANLTFLDTSARVLAPGEVSAGSNAAASKSPARPSGGRRPDLPGVDRPAAEGTEAFTRRATFSPR